MKYPFFGKAIRNLSSLKILFILICLWSTWLRQEESSSLSFYFWKRIVFLLTFLCGQFPTIHTHCQHPPPNPRHRSWSRSTLTLKLDQSTQKQVRTWLDPIIYFPQYLIKNGYFTLQILLDWLILLILYLLFINFFEIALFWLLKFQFYYSGICHHSVFQISFFKL